MSNAGSTDRRGMQIVVPREDKTVMSDHTVTFNEIVNLTRHRVVVVDDQNRILIEFDAARFSATIEGGRAAVPFRGNNIRDVPIVVRSFGKCIGLPPFRNGVGLIVSKMVADAFPERKDLLLSDAGSDDALRDQDGRIVAVRRLIVANVVLTNP